MRRRAQALQSNHFVDGKRRTRIGRKREKKNGFSRWGREIQGRKRKEERRLECKRIKREVEREERRLGHLQNLNRGEGLEALRRRVVPFRHLPFQILFIYLNHVIIVSFNKKKETCDSS